MSLHARAATLASSVAMAVTSLRINPLRSALTMLGITIGITAVSLALAIGGGAQLAVARSISAMGTNLAVVYPEPDTGKIRRSATRGRLTERDARAIGREVLGIRAMAPQLRSDARASVSGASIPASVIGTTPGYPLVTGRLVASGRFIDDGDERRSARVLVLGASSARRLFGDADGIGAKVNLDRVLFTVVGVLEPAGGGFGGGEDDLAIVPLGTLRKRLLRDPGSGPDDLHSLFVGFEEGVDLAEARAQVVDLLRNRYHLRDADVSSFTVRTTEQFMKESSQITRVLQIVLAAMASIALLVGGVGIMNMMLVTVMERTREIGLRMAIGARRRDVRDQFMMEAAVLCLGGGLAGLCLALTVSFLVGRFAGFAMPVSPWQAVGAISFSICLGLVFGAYPAVRASRLTPIEALRSE